jgi:uncharacterized protein (TIGR02466 family)
MPTHNLFAAPIYIKDFEGAELDELQNAIAGALDRLTLHVEDTRHQLRTTFDIVDGVNDIRRSNLEPLAWGIWGAMKAWFTDLELDPIELEIRESWFNHYKNGEFMFDHEHPNSIVSGVYYYAVPEDSGGDLWFRSPNPLMHHRVWPQTGNPDYQQFQVKPQVGRLVLFPSWLTHSVMPTTGDEEKISISFNLMPPPPPMEGPSLAQIKLD